MVCLDMWLGKEVWPQLRETMLALRRIQPDVMFRARGIGNYGDYYTPERFVPGDKEATDMPWFVIYPLGQGFSYAGAQDHYKGSPWVIENLVDTVAKGGNFMVGWAPPRWPFQPHGHPSARRSGSMAEGERRSDLRQPATPWRFVERGRGSYLFRAPVSEWRRASCSWNECPDSIYAQQRWPSVVCGLSPMARTESFAEYGSSKTR